MGLAAVHGGLVPPIRELVIVRLPPVSWMPPPPRPELASWLFERVTAVEREGVVELAADDPPAPDGDRPRDRR